MTKLTEKQMQRFMAKIDRTGACWLWTSTTRKGYGRFLLNGRVLPAHVVAYTALRGEIPAGQLLDHTCKVTRCVNPDHLDPVPHKENVRRSDAPTGINARKTECLRGHPFDEENTRYERQKDGSLGRRCRACERLRMARRRVTPERRAYVNQWQGAEEHKAYMREYKRKRRQSVRST
jgi:hypothetical protein